LRHGLRSAGTEPGLKAVAGSDPPLSMPSAGIAEGWDVHIPDTLPGGSLPSISPLREGHRGRVPRSVAKPKRWSQRNRRGEGAARSLLDREGSSGESRGDGDARRSDRRVDGERLLRRLEAALNGLPARIVGAGATPGRRGRVVKTHSPLCRTKPSGRGVAPAAAIAARSAPDDRSASPQDVATAPVARSLPCESAERRIVNRPPASFSHSGAAQEGAPGPLLSPRRGRVS